MRRGFLLRALLGVLGLFAGTTAFAATFDTAQFSIDLPGYVGPVEHAAGAGMSRGFRKPHPGTPLSTVVFVTVQEMGATFARRAGVERMRLTRETLASVVAGIEANRTGFRKSAPQETSIAGHPGLKVSWSGAAQGIAFEGVVYCVLVGSRAYAIQVQDAAGQGRERLAEAMQAVEGMRIAR